MRLGLRSGSLKNEGALYFRTDNDTGKLERIERNPRIRVAPCEARGTLKGSWVEAQAEFANKDETEQAHQLLKQKYGLQYRGVRFVGRVRGKSSKSIVLAIRI